MEEEGVGKERKLRKDGEADTSEHRKAETEIDTEGSRSHLVWFCLR